MTPFLTLLRLAGVLAGVVLTAIARARKLGDSWESAGLAIATAD